MHRFKGAAGGSLVGGPIALGIFAIALIIATIVDEPASLEKATNTFTAASWVMLAIGLGLLLLWGLTAATKDVADVVDFFAVSGAIVTGWAAFFLVIGEAPSWGAVLFIAVAVVTAIVGAAIVFRRRPEAPPLGAGSARSDAEDHFRAASPDELDRFGALAPHRDATTGLAPMAGIVVWEYRKIGRKDGQWILQLPHLARDGRDLQALDGALRLLRAHRGLDGWSVIELTAETQARPGVAMLSIPELTAAQFNDVAPKLHRALLDAAVAGLPDTEEGS